MESWRASVGRNDPCPCGSGKKYKHCCLATGVRVDPVGLMRESLALHQAGQLDAAWAGYRKVLAIAPQRADAWYLSGLIDQARSHLARARESMTEALGLEPDNVLFAVGLGVVQQLLADLPAAEASYRQALALHPEHVEARNNLANVLKDQGKHGEAAEQYRLALQSVDNPVVCYNLANLLQEQHALDEAIAMYQRALAMQPVYPEAHANLGSALQRVGQLPEAEAQFRLAIAQRPGYAEAWNNLGNVLKEQGDARTAIGYYREAIALMPGNAGMHNNLGHVLKTVGEHAAAIAAYRDAVAIDPDYAEAWAALAGVYQDRGDVTASIACWQRAHELMPQAIEPLNNLGCVLHAADQTAEAILAYRKALAIDATTPALHYNLASVLHACGDIDAALAEYAEALRLKDDYIEALNNQGNAQKDAGNYPAAEASYQRVLALRPDSAEAHCNLAILYSLLERYDEAVAIYRHALTLQPDLVVAHRNLAALLIREGRMADARFHMDAAYSRQCWFEEKHPGVVRTVLVLLGTEKGNVPFSHLFPVARNNTVEWMIEYDEQPESPQLPAYDIVFNAMGEPDMTSQYADLVEGFMQHCQRPIMNPPHAVARTARDHVEQLFGDIPGLLIPPVWRVHQHAALPDDLTWPLLVRPMGSHGGEGLFRLDNLEQQPDLHAAFPGQDLYLTAWFDYRSADGWYRKYRFVFINGEPFPYHLAISAHWMVHYATADMLVDWKLAEEQRFLADPAVALGADVMRVVRSIGQRIGLDFAGADLGIMPDGQVLLFEANATMLVHAELKESRLTFKNPYVEAIYAALDVHMQQLINAAPADCSTPNAALR